MFTQENLDLSDR